MMNNVLSVLASIALVSGARVARDSGYGAPEPSYRAPEVSYTAPASSYGEPEAYAPAPSQEYSSPAYTAEGEVLDIQSLVLPILVIVALFLLFPNFINLTTVRRSFANEGPMELMDKVKDIAQAVLEDKDILTKYD